MGGGAGKNYVVPMSAAATLFRRGSTIIASEHEDIVESEQPTSPTLPYPDKLENHGFVGDFYIFDKHVIYKDGNTAVRKVTHRHNKRERALKQYNKQKIQNCSEAIKAQVGLLQAMNAHPNIVRLYEVFEDKMFFYMVFEFCHGGRLLDHIRAEERHTERETACVIQQAAKAVAYMHRNNICHRDIKPEHLMIKHPGWLASCLVKIIDVGHARVLNRRGETMTDKVGTPFYSSPQVLQGCYTEACDVWSLGVVMYLTLLGFPTRTRRFSGHNLRRLEIPSTTNEKLFEDRNVFHFSPSDWEVVSEGARDALGRLLCETEQDRVTASGLLGHAWLVRSGPQAENVRVQLSSANMSAPVVKGAGRLRLVPNYTPPAKLKMVQRDDSSEDTSCSVDEPLERLSQEENSMTVRSFDGDDE